MFHFNVKKIIPKGNPYFMYKKKRIYGKKYHKFISKKGMISLKFDKWFVVRMSRRARGPGIYRSICRLRV